MVELRVGHNLQDIIKIIENKMMILIPKFDQYIVFTHCIVSKLMCDYIQIMHGMLYNLSTQIAENDQPLFSPFIKTHQIASFQPLIFCHASIGSQIRGDRKLRLTLSVSCIYFYQGGQQVSGCCQWCYCGISVNIIQRFSQPLILILYTRVRKYSFHKCTISNL